MRHHAVGLGEARLRFMFAGSGIALASTAKMLANFFLMYVAPRKDDYRLFVVSQTPDFSPDTAHEQRVLTQARRTATTLHHTAPAQCIRTAFEWKTGQTQPTTQRSSPTPQ